MRTLLVGYIAFMLAIFYFIFFAKYDATARDFSENDFRQQSRGIIGSEVMGNVYTFCEDHVVCFEVSGWYGGSGSCFREQDLYDKYCK